VNDFNKKSASSDGYQCMRKTCSVDHIKEWNNNNCEYVRERQRNRLVTNPQYKISRNTHNKLWSILKRGSYTCRTEQIIGLNIQTFLKWLSYNFENEMTWANYVEVWHIDLVIPASAYDLTDEQQLLTAFCWKNIRPSLKSENLAKYNIICHFTIANQRIRVLGFIRKMRQIRIEHFLQNIE